jgi:hypothetical protein
MADLKTLTPDHSRHQCGRPDQIERPAVCIQHRLDHVEG